VLQNCHLARSWLHQLDRIVAGLSTDTAARDFRLFLTSAPSPTFPLSVLRRSVKVVNEPAGGVAASMSRALAQLDAEWFEQAAQPRSFQRLLLSLCFFHAALLGRRRYGSLGFAVTYDFSDSDLGISVAQLRHLLDDAASPQALRAVREAKQRASAMKASQGAASQSMSISSARKMTKSEAEAKAKAQREMLDQQPESVPFEALRYLIGHCYYGGRVTDARDRRTLLAMLRVCMHDGIVHSTPEEDEHAAHELQEGSGPTSLRLCESGAYRLPVLPPDNRSLHDHRRYVEMVMPNEDDPETFGLHSNAAAAQATAEAHDVLQTLLSLEHQDASQAASAAAAAAATGPAS